jgi:hypothetical protein
VSLSPDPYLIRDATTLAKVTELAATGDPAALRAVRDYKMYALYKKEKRMYWTKPEEQDAVARAIIDASDVNVPAKPIPSGVHVLGVKRIGDCERDAYLERLREAHAGGYIDLPEFEARQAAMMTATMKGELEYMTKDLPEPAPASKPKSLTAPSKPLVALKKTSPREATPLSITATLLLVVAVIGAAITGGLALSVPAGMVAIIAIIAIGWS